MGMRVCRKIWRLGKGRLSGGFGGGLMESGCRLRWRVSEAGCDGGGGGWMGFFTHGVLEVGGEYEYQCFHSKLVELVVGVVVDVIFSANSPVPTGPSCCHVQANSFFLV
jgi:hypothetical protein